MKAGDELAARLITQSHIIDDVDSRRATLARRARQHLDLLTTALEALRAGDVHVTDEYLERVIAVLTRDVRPAR